MGSPLPARAISGHLTWGLDGSVWATFQLEPFAYPHRSVRDAQEVHAHTVGALLALPRHALILSLAHALSPGELERRIRGRVDLHQAPGWAADARRIAARLATEPVYERIWLLSVRLPDRAGARRFGDWLRVAASAIGAGFGSPHVPPGRARVSEALGEASALEEQLSQHLRLRRLTSRQVRWIYETALLRGLADPPFPEAHGDDATQGAVIRLDRDAVYFEGGRREDPDRPGHRRYLTVDHPDFGTGHQTFSCLAETPASWTFPYGSGEWLWHLDDQLPFPVDWALRLERVNNDAARRRALRAKRNLVGQLDEPGGDPAGPATSLSAATEAVDEHRSRLEANPALPAFRATTIAALAHRRLDFLERQAAVLESTFRTAEHNFYRPTGAQLACFTAMLPGSAAPSVVSEYAQDLLPDGLATALPFAGSGVGDPHGMLLGHSLDTLCHRPILLDPAHGPRDLNRSGSLAAVGELGAGKSFLAKTLTLNTVAMGGQVVAIDRTEAAEYTRLAQVVAGSSQVVEVTDEANVSLDPFRVFGSDELRLRYGVGFVTLLTATPPGSAAGTHIHRAAQHALDTAHSTGQPAGLFDVVDHLEAAGGPGAEVADKLPALSEVSYGRLVFGDPGPALSLNADYVCFHIPGLRLPRRNANREDLLPEELLGQAILYLVAAFSRRVLFRDPDRFAALLLDEAHALTANPQGRALVGDLIRDGRKHFAAVWAFSQLPSDFTTSDEDTSLDSLLGYRVVFRQARQSAAAALAFLGSDGRPDNIETITGLGTGECLLRDPAGRLGLVRIVPPEDPAALVAFSTTPRSEAVAVGPWQALNGDQATSPAGPTDLLDDAARR